MNKINLLITAAGGDIGQSILKILKGQNFIDKLVCCDISEDNAAPILFENFEIVKKVDDVDFIPSLENLVEKHKIDLIIPVSEAELRFFNKNKIENILNAKLIMANNYAMDIGFDKYLTTKFLQENSLICPWTMKVNENGPINFPCIFKDSKGCGSKGIFKLENKEDYNFYSSKYPDFIAQEYLEGDEYTCGVYQSQTQDVRIIIFKRQLKGGLTGVGQLVENNEIKELLSKIAKALKLKGSINIQLRMTKKGPMVFEINPRFSSTVLFRDKLGFKDLIWSIKEKINEPIDDYKPISKNVKFYKIYDEIICYE